VLDGEIAGLADLTGQRIPRGDEWRTRLTPRWMAVGVMVAAPLDVFGPGQLLVHNGLPALSWILTGIAFFGVSLALLRTSNDDFDLRPIAPVR
jgi:hypothetical protein